MTDRTDTHVPEEFAVFRTQAADGLDGLLDENQLADLIGKTRIRWQT